MCERRGLEVTVKKSLRLVLGREKESDWEVSLDGSVGAKCYRKVGCVPRSFVIARSVYKSAV